MTISGMQGSSLFRTALPSAARGQGILEGQRFPPFRDGGAAALGSNGWKSGPCRTTIDGKRGWEMDEQHTVFLIGGGTGGDEQAVFTLRSSETGCHLTCSYRDKVIEAEEEDYFEALFQIRQQLELDGLLPFVMERAGMFIRKEQ
jgi:hypothetical protein